MRKYLFQVTLLLVMFACVVPGMPAPQVEPLPSFDPNALGTTIALTAAVAQTQTALKLPTATYTPLPTRTPSLTPTYTPTFLFALPTLTPIPTFTVPPTIGTLETPGEKASGGDEGEEGKTETKKKDEDPRKMSGKEWSCVWYGLKPPRHTIFKPKTPFTVEWTLFNSGTKTWPFQGVDFIYQSGFRHEGTKIQDFFKSVPSGGEIKVTASFIAPKAPGEYQTFFNLLVGKRKFCPVAYYFKVED